MNAAERGLRELLHPLKREQALGVPEDTGEQDRELRLNKAAKELGERSVPHAVGQTTEVPPANNIG